MDGGGREGGATGSEGFQRPFDVVDLVEIDVVDVAGADQAASQERRQDLAAEDEALHGLVDGADAVHVVGHELVIRVHPPESVVDFGQADDLPFLQLRWAPKMPQSIGGDSIKSFSGDLATLHHLTDLFETSFPKQSN